MVDCKHSMNPDEQLEPAIASVPPGPWGVAVSGGADSVALLYLLNRRSDLRLTVIHLDHETRQGQSTRDAEFVATMAGELSLPLVRSTRSAVGPRLSDPPANPQALYRALRHELYRQAVEEHGLYGVLLGHHADDQTETVLMRLLRGAGIEGLCGIPRETVLGGIRILRPLLSVRRQLLREYLRAHGIPWREDASNASPHYQRNRVRILLDGHPELAVPLLEVAEAFARLSAWLDQETPRLIPSPMVRNLRDLDPLVQLHALRTWLLDQGIPGDEISLALLGRIREMVEDSASPPAIAAPGGVEVRRRGGRLMAQRRCGPGSPVHPRPRPRPRRAPDRPDQPEATP